MFLPWRVSGARLQLPRDLEIAYAVGRMGIVTVADTYPLWYGSCHTARFGFGRLTRLGLVRSFPRDSPLSPAWFSLTARGLGWTAEESGCDERELRAVVGIRHTNLAAAFFHAPQAFVQIRHGDVNHPDRRHSLWDRTLFHRSSRSTIAC